MHLVRFAADDTPAGGGQAGGLAWTLQAGMGCCPTRPSRAPLTHATTQPWRRDDREDVVLAAEMPLDQGAPSPLPPSAADMMAHTAELERYAAAEAAAAKQRLAKDLMVLPHHRPSPSPCPALEVTVMRVVGCDMLTNSLTGRDFTVVTFTGGCGPGGHVVGASWGSATAAAASTAAVPPAAPGCLPTRLLQPSPQATPAGGGATPKLAAMATRTTRAWCACRARAASRPPSPRSCWWMAGRRRRAPCRWRSCTRCGVEWGGAG